MLCTDLCTNPKNLKIRPEIADFPKYILSYTYTKPKTTVNKHSLIRTAYLLKSYPRTTLLKS